MSADFWAGYLSGAVGILIGNPLDLIKVRLQAGAASRRPQAHAVTTPLRHAVAAIVAGATGAAAPIAGYGALNALLFVSYRQTERMLNGNTAFSFSPATTAWLAGAVAGVATWIVSAPTELIKCRAQLAPVHPYPPAYAASAPSPSSSSFSSWAIARHVLRTEGVSGFFVGGTVTVLRDSIGYGFYFWSYVLATDAWRHHCSSAPKRVDQTGPAVPLSAAGTLLCGGLAGIVTWASIFPLDVIKTRMQAQTATPAPTSVVAPLLNGRPAQRYPHPSMLTVARQTYCEGGLGAFFRGLGVCSARAFVVNAVQWAVYEWTMRRLGTNNIALG